MCAGSGILSESLEKKLHFVRGGGVYKKGVKIQPLCKQRILMQQFPKVSSSKRHVSPGHPASPKAKFQGENAVQIQESLFSRDFS